MILSLCVSALLGAGPVKPAAPTSQPTAPAKAPVKIPQSSGAAAKPAPAIAKLDIVVERKRNGRIEAVDPATVFASGDLVRFRFKSNFTGYLYVMNTGTSGEHTVLFPREDTGQENRIETGRDYLIPMTEAGWFQITGPAGHEVMYWLVSLTAREARVPARPPGAPVVAPPPDDARITPRCDDAIFRARGECLDPTAGPKPAGASVPAPLEPFSAPARELTVLKSGKSTAVAVPSSQQTPFLYTFRLAHK